MSGEWNIERVASAFTAAATEPARWADALGVIARETGSVGAVILPIKGRTPFVPLSVSLEEGMEAYFREGWHACDRRHGAIPRILRTGVGVDYDFTTEDAIRTDPFYQEFLARYGLKYFGGVKLSAGDDLWCISLQRSPGAGPFSETEQSRMASLGPRLSGAATLAQAIGFAHLTGMATGLEHAGIAAILLDRQGRVVQLNPRAERLLGPDLSVRGQHLIPSDPALRRAVERMVGAALGLCGVVSVPLPIAVPKASGRPLVLHAVPLPEEASLFFAPARALILIRDLNQAEWPPDSHLQAVFGLTGAEARLATAIAAGDGVRAAAERLGISANTAHTQLAAVFAKTGTSRQAELVRVLSRLANIA